MVFSRYFFLFWYASFLFCFVFGIAAPFCDDKDGTAQFSVETYRSLSLVCWSVVSFFLISAATSNNVD